MGIEFISANTEFLSVYNSHSVNHVALFVSPENKSYTAKSRELRFTDDMCAVYNTVSIRVHGTCVYKVSHPKTQIISLVQTFEAIERKSTSLH